MNKQKQLIKEMEKEKCEYFDKKVCSRLNCKKDCKYYGKANCYRCIHKDICELRSFSYCEEEVREKGCDDFRQEIPENAVVLTREEYEKVKYILKYEPEEAIIRLEDLSKNEALYNPFMFCSLAGCSGVRKGCNRTCKESWIVIERKETAEKIMNEISGDILIVNTKEYGNIEVIPVERLQEICTNIIEGN